MLAVLTGMSGRFPVFSTLRTQSFRAPLDVSFPLELFQSAVRTP